MSGPDAASPALGLLCALASALSWTLIGLVARALSPYLNMWSINMIRAAVAGTVLVALMLASGGHRSLAALEVRWWVALMVSVVTAFAIGDTAFLEATRWLGLGRAMTVSMVYPLMAAALGLWWLGEPVTAMVFLGALVTLGGLVLVVTERTPVTAGQAPAQRRHGLVLALVAAAAWAVSAALVRPAMREIDPITAQAIRVPVAALVLWCAPPARGAAARLREHLREAGPLLLVISALTVASAVTFVAAIKYAGVAVATVASSTSPLFALTIGLVAFGERVTWRAAAGTVLCVSGIALLGVRWP
jgi:drug/metabolite transporter (DMT)-like permease